MLRWSGNRARTRHAGLSEVEGAGGIAIYLDEGSRALPRNPIPDHVRVYEAIAASDPVSANAEMRTLIDLALADTQLAMAAQEPDLPGHTVPIC